MSSELNHLLSLASAGKMSRRDFVGRAGALGVSTAMAGTMLSTAAFADTPVKGGVLRAGVQGGQSTDSLDPALAASDVPFMINSTWGETLVDAGLKGQVEYRVAEEISSNADATEWKFKIRKGVEYHNGATLKAEDVVATLKRHTDEKSQSGALGIVKGIKDMKAEGDMVTLTLNAANADLPFLMADYHLVIQPGGGQCRRQDHRPAPLFHHSVGLQQGDVRLVEDQPLRHEFFLR
jgi:peptide/nickel transport system substrate-binding protein